MTARSAPLGLLGHETIFRIKRLSKRVLERSHRESVQAGPVDDVALSAAAEASVSRMLQCGEQDEDTIVAAALAQLGRRTSPTLPRRDH
jgi:hypothetical protein